MDSDEYTREQWYSKYFRRLDLMLSVLLFKFGCLSNRKLINFVQKTSCIIILILYWFNLLRYLYFFKPGEVFGLPMLTKILYAVSAFQQAGFMTIFIYNTKKLELLIVKFGKLYCHDMLETPLYENTLKWIYLILPVTVIIAAVGSTCGFLYMSIQEYDPNSIMTYLVPLGEESKIRRPLLYITGVSGFFNILQLGAFLFYFGIICFLIFKEFAQLTKRTQNLISSSAYDPIEIKDIRRKHDAVCQMVGVADDIFEHFIGITFACSITKLCLLLYNLSMEDYHVTVLGGLSVHLALAACFMIVTVVGGIKINTMVTICYIVIDNINFNCFGQYLRDKYELEITTTSNRISLLMKVKVVISQCD